jgi:membrane protein
MMPAQSNHLYDRRKPDVGAEDRGRVAEAPSQIPAKGWRDVLLRVFHGISEDRITTMSAGVTFFVLLAVFPGLAGLISLYGLLPEPSASTWTAWPASFLKAACRSSASSSSS